MEKKKMGLLLLVMLGIGSMIGGGIFNSPTDLLSSANPQTTLIAWAIGGIGVICLALVFRFLSIAKPELKGGIYSYARAGFGEFIGFNSAWGYWISALLGNVSFFILMFKTINSLLAEGKGIDPLFSFIIASLLLWIIHYAIARGIRSAGVLNAVVTLAKLIPLVLIIMLGLFLFTPSTFFVPNWESVLISTGEKSPVFTQISGAMGTILWCFVGIEAAVVLSERAQSQKIIGKAIVISIFITLVIYILISTIAMGVVPAEKLINSGTPLAEVLNATFLGRAGGTIVQLGLIVSILGATLSWVMLAAETPYVAAKDGVMPKWFAKENKRGIPVNSLLLTNILTQIFLFSMFSETLQSAYYMVYYIATTTILLPYLLSALYSLKVAAAEQAYRGYMAITIIASIYAVYVIYAVGIVYLGTAIIMYSIGTLIFYIAKREKGEKLSSVEITAVIILLILALYMAYQIATGKIIL